MAEDLTHRRGQFLRGHESEAEFYKKYGEDCLKKYKELSGGIRFALLRGGEDRCKDLIKILKEYRQEHPAMYEDVKSRPIFRKKFEIISE